MNNDNPALQQTETPWWTQEPQTTSLSQTLHSIGYTTEAIESNNFDYTFGLSDYTIKCGCCYKMDTACYEKLPWKIPPPGFELKVVAKDERGITGENILSKGWMPLYYKDYPLLPSTQFVVLLSNIGRHDLAMQITNRPQGIEESNAAMLTLIPTSILKFVPTTCWIPDLSQVEKVFGYLQHVSASPMTSDEKHQLLRRLTDDVVRKNAVHELELSFAPAFHIMYLANGRDQLLATTILLECAASIVPSDSMWKKYERIIEISRETVEQDRMGNVVGDPSIAATEPGTAANSKEDFSDTESSSASDSNGTCTDSISNEADNEDSDSVPSADLAQIQEMSSTLIKQIINKIENLFQS